MKVVIVAIIAVAVAAGAFVLLSKNDDANSAQTQATQTSRSSSLKGAKSVSDCKATSDGTAKFACLKSLNR